MSRARARFAVNPSGAHGEQTRLIPPFVARRLAAV